jgi:hypothetical protein
MLPAARCRLLARSRNGAMSDLSPLCAPKRNAASQIVSYFVDALRSARCMRRAVSNKADTTSL